MACCVQFYLRAPSPTSLCHLMLVGSSGHRILQHGASLPWMSFLQEQPFSDSSSIHRKWFLFQHTNRYGIAVPVRCDCVPRCPSKREAVGQGKWPPRFPCHFSVGGSTVRSGSCLHGDCAPTVPVVTVTVGSLGKGDIPVINLCVTFEFCDPSLFRV